MSKQSEYLHALGRGQSDTRHFFVFFLNGDRQRKEAGKVEPARRVITHLVYASL